MAFEKETRANRQRPQDEIRTLMRQVVDRFGALDRDTFNRRPAEDRWSVGECIDHINAAARLYVPVLTDAIHEARRKGGTGNRQKGMTLLGRLFVWSQEPPPKWWSRMGTWPELEPARDLDPGETLDEFQALHEELIVRMNEASDLNLKKVKVRSVLNSRLKLSLGDWFSFIGAHARRHMWQAGEVLKDLGEDLDGER